MFKTHKAVSALWVLNLNGTYFKYKIYKFKFAAYYVFSFY